MAIGHVKKIIFSKIYVDKWIRFFLKGHDQFREKKAIKSRKISG